MATTDSQHVARPTAQPVRLKPRPIPKSLIEFQPDAVEIEKRSVPGGARWTLYTVAALIASAIAWACWAKVDRIVVAQGTLVTLEPPIVIQPLASSVIRDIRVRFGDVVRRNDVLAILDSTLSEADVAKLQSRTESLAAAIARLTAERDGVEFDLASNAESVPWRLEARVFQDRANEFAAKKETIDAERRKLVVQQSNNQGEIASWKERLEILEQFYDKIEQLQKKGSESQLELWKADIDRLDAKRSLEKAENDREQLIKDLELNARRREEFEAEWRSKISTDLLAASRERDELVEEMTKARRLNELVELRVPDDLPSEAYVVLEVADRSPGSAPKPGESLFKLVPVNAQLEAEVEIPARDIGLVKPGNDSRIKLAAFPYQKHGTLAGEIVTISEGSFQKGEPPATATLYRSRIQLGSTAGLKNMPAQYRLLPGMEVSVEIRVGERRVIEYFVYPILRNLDSSIREP
jgi:HlyD family secretion protein